MGTSLSSARRLVLTEQAYFTSIAQKDAYAELDVEEFEFVGTLDGKTCGDCGELDGQHFPMKDMMPGVNAAPMHPFCRCTTAPYCDDEFTIGKRIAKDKDGEYYEVPEKMTFDEWKETFVDGGSKDDLTVVTEGDTVKSKRDYDSDLAQNFGKDHYDGMHDLIDSCVNDDLRDVSEDAISFSAKMTEHLTEYGFTLYDTSHNREKVLRQIIDDRKSSDGI